VKAELDGYRNKLVIPKSAVLWTGSRSIVYVKQVDTGEPVFKMREIGLGPMLGNSYVITDGLTEGEEIVTQGTFSVDAAAQLEGKPSMMNPHKIK
jgi:Cu(I)/Ag(I) efflux system membrane fusion protein